MAQLKKNTNNVQISVHTKQNNANNHERARQLDYFKKFKDKILITVLHHFTTSVQWEVTLTSTTTSIESTVTDGTTYIQAPIRIWWHWGQNSTYEKLPTWCGPRCGLCELILGSDSHATYHTHCHELQVHHTSRMNQLPAHTHCCKTPAQLLPWPC